MTTEEITKIVKELEQYEADLFAASTDYKSLAQDAATKRSVYDVAWAQELLKIKADANLKATVPEREAMATVSVQRFMTDARVAEAMADGSKRHLTALQAILSSVQTRSKLINTEWIGGNRQP